MERNIESMAREAAEAARCAFGDEFIDAETAADFCHEVEADEPGTYPDFANPLPAEDGWKLKDAYLVAWNAMARQAKQFGKEEGN